MIVCCCDQRRVVSKLATCAVNISSVFLLSLIRPSLIVFCLFVENLNE